jgi:hypothetical protein
MLNVILNKSPKSVISPISMFSTYAGKMANEESHQRTAEKTSRGS